MTFERMDNVGIVAADIDAAIEFFNELRLELEGARPDRRRLGGWCHWIARHARRDRDDAHAGRPRPA
jgi:catechol 2,3-dioxygenase-like lactoylglutathione lyase family enzyme